MIFDTKFNVIVNKNFYIIKKSRLEINKLHLSFETRTIFHNLQLQVFPGNRVIIVGENGVGKSTLLKLIKGSNYVFNGSVKVEGKVGYLPQTFEDFLSRTVLEHLIVESNNLDLVEW